jgi:hypothetical protein
MHQFDPLQSDDEEEEVVEIGGGLEEKPVSE